MVYPINEHTSEYTTPESTTSAQDASQAVTSTNNHLVRVPTRVLVHDKIHKIHNHIQRLLHDATLPSTFPLIQMMKY